MRAHAGLFALAILPLACATPTTLIQQGRLTQAWRDVCERDSVTGQRAELTTEERIAFRQALEKRTRGTFHARALSRQSIHQRLGGNVFPKEVVLLITHVEAFAYPGRGLFVTPRIVTQGETLNQLATYGGTWRYVGIEEPTRGYGPTLKPFNIPGAAVDLVVAGLSVGIIDLNLRDQKDLIDPGKPGTPGTGTDLQQQTLFQFSNGYNATSARDTNFELQPARYERPIDTFYLLGAVPASSENSVLTLDTEPLPSQKDVFILRIEHQPDRESNAWCHFEHDLVFQLPEGPDLASRINALFAKGPLQLGAQ